MDKLKSMMSSNKDKDTTSTDNTATGDLSNKNTVSGQGSHFGSGHSTDTNPLSSSTNPTSATGSNLTGTGMQGLNEPHSSRMPGGFDDDTTSTASVSSGIPGRGQTGKPIGTAAYDSGVDTNKPLPSQPGTSGVGLTSHGMTGSGLGDSSTISANPYSSSARGIDPRVDSDLSGRGGGLGSTNTGTGHGLTGNTSSGLGSGTAGTGTAGAGTGLGNTTDSGRSFPLGGNSSTGTTTGSNTAYTAPGQVGTYAAGGTAPGRTGASSGLTGNTTAGPHSSNIENSMDPRVDSNRDGRSGLGNTTGAGASSGSTGNTTAGPHSSNLENKMDPRVDSDRDGRSGLGNTTSSTTGTGYGSGSTGTGLGSNTTAGPHSSNLENKIDPRVDSDRDGRSGLGKTATGTGQTGHLGRDAALGAGAGATAAGMGAGYGPESWEHQHRGHSHNYEGDPCGPGTAAPGGPSFTSGPHVTDTANRLDPHVNSGVGATGSGLGSSSGTGLGSSTTGTGLGSSTTGTRSGFDSTTTGSASDPYGSSSTGTGHHHGRDAALAAGAGTAGVGAYEAGRGGPQSGSTGPAPNTAGPHKSDMLNKLDPRVDSDLSKQQPTSGTSAGGATTTGPGSHLGSSTTGASSDPYASSTAGTGHHTGRDAALAGGAGAAGLGAYEAEKHHHAGNDPTGTSGLGSSTTTGAPHHSHHQGHHDRQQHASEHHLGRDAGLAGAGTAAAYEAERHHGHPTQSSTIPSTTGGMTSNSRDPMTSGHGHQSGTGHHLGRDAGLAGAGGVGAYEAEKHLGQHDTAGERLAGSGHNPNTTSSMGTGTGSLTNDPTLSGTQSGTTGTGHRDHHLGRDAALGAGAGGAAYEAEKHHHNKHDPTGTTGVTGSQDPQHHYGRDAALGAGAAGAGYEADKHHHDKEARKLEHEREKEAKHQDSGKKSGILGLFSRDKGDKEAHREERAEEKAQYDRHTGLDAGVATGAAGTAYEAEKHHHNRGPGNEAMAPVTGATGLESDMKNTSLGDRQGNLGGGHSMAGTGEGMHGSQAGVHDSAISSGSGVAGIGGGPTTHDAYGDQDPNRINRLHKDPPAGRGL